jgi:RNA polymerase sigma-70 factor, ECF subfamily
MIAPAGPAARLDALVREYRAAVLAVCLAHTRDIHEAEDRVQDVFLKALDKLDTLRDESKSRAWLLQIARRTCVDHGRGRRRVEPIPEHVPQPVHPPDERIEHVLAAVARLPEDLRETVALYYLDGRSCDNVAASLGTTAAAIRQRLVRARLKLHEWLTEDRS